VIGRQLSINSTKKAASIGKSERDVGKGNGQREGNQSINGFTISTKKFKNSLFLHVPNKETQISAGGIYFWIIIDCVYLSVNETIEDTANFTGLCFFYSLQFATMVKFFASDK